MILPRATRFIIDPRSGRIPLYLILAQTGNVTMNVAPSPSLLSTVNVPP